MAIAFTISNIDYRRVSNILSRDCSKSEERLLDLLFWIYIKSCKTEGYRQILYCQYSFMIIYHFCLQLFIRVLKFKHEKSILLKETKQSRRFSETVVRKTCVSQTQWQLNIFPGHIKLFRWNNDYFVDQCEINSERTN